MRLARVGGAPAAHANELASVNEDGASFIIVRAARPGMGKNSVV